MERRRGVEKEPESGVGVGLIHDDLSHERSSENSVNS
jgi:hypothetical protein